MAYGRDEGGGFYQLKWNNHSAHSERHKRHDSQSVLHIEKGGPKGRLLPNRGMEVFYLSSVSICCGAELACASIAMPVC